jgi:hypothetical protein
MGQRTQNVVGVRKAKNAKSATKRCADASDRSSPKIPTVVEFVGAGHLARALSEVWVTGTSECGGRF